MDKARHSEGVLISTADSCCVINLSIRHVFVDLSIYIDLGAFVNACIGETHMRVEEERVGTPCERLGPPVQVVVRRGLGEFATVLVLNMLGMGRVLNFGVVYPGSAHGDCNMVLKV